jgi:Tol biopolymer transport system component
MRVLLVLLATAIVVSPGAAGPQDRGAGWVYYSAYARSAQGVNLELFRVLPDGTARQRLTRNGSIDFGVDPSPNGRRLVFVRYMSGTVDGLTNTTGLGFTTLWLVDVNGTRLRKLVPAREFLSEWPRWSPDGLWLAFQSQCGFGSTGGPDSTCIELSVIRPDGSDELRLAESSTGGSRSSVSNGTAWSWSADSRTIAFERPRDRESDVMEVVLVDVVTKAQRVVTVGTQPAYAPRGRLLAVVKGRRIAVVDETGAVVRRLSPPPAAWRDEAPSWSPDARRIAFWRTRLDGEATRLVLTGPGALVRSVQLTDPATRRIVWSPAGNNVLVSASFGSATSVFRVDAGSGTVVRLGRGYAQAWGRQPR